MRFQPLLKENPNKDNFTKEKYLEQTTKKLEHNWPKTKILSLHPYRNIALGLLTIMIVISLHIQGKTNRTLLALADLGGSSRGQLKNNH